MEICPPYTETETEIYDDSYIIPSYFSVIECDKMIVIHIKDCKSKQVMITPTYCLLEQDSIKIPLGKYKDLDADSSPSVQKMDKNVTIIIPRKRIPSKVGFNRFRFSRLYRR